MEGLLFIGYMTALLGFFCAVGALSWLLEKVTVVIELGGWNSTAKENFAFGKLCLSVIAFVVSLIAVAASIVF